MDLRLAAVRVAIVELNPFWLDFYPFMPAMAWASGQTEADIILLLWGPRFALPFEDSNSLRVGIPSGPVSELSTGYLAGKLINTCVRCMTSNERSGLRQATGGRGQAS